MNETIRIEFAPPPTEALGIRPQGGASWGSTAAPLLVLSRSLTPQDLQHQNQKQCAIG